MFSKNALEKRYYQSLFNFHIFPHSKDGNDDFLNAECWTELNEWVIQFQRVFKEVLQAYGDKEYLSPKLLQEGKIIRTPYGGRVEYIIAGYPFIIHLKDADKVRIFYNSFLSVSNRSIFFDVLFKNKIRLKGSER